MIYLAKEVQEVQLYSLPNDVHPYKICVYVLSRVQLFATPWTAAPQAPLSMEFSRQEYWSGLPFPTLEDLPNLGIEPESPAFAGDSLPLCHLGSPYKIFTSCYNLNYVPLPPALLPG